MPRQAAAIYRNAIAGVDFAGNARSGQLQLRSAIGRSNPEDAPISSIRPVNIGAS